MLCALQSLLTAQWPLELQQNKHSCIKQLQNVYLSPHAFGNIVGSFDLRNEAPDDTEMLDLSQVKTACIEGPSSFIHPFMHMSVCTCMHAYTHLCTQLPSCPSA